MTAFGSQAFEYGEKFTSPAFLEKLNALRADIDALKARAEEDSDLGVGEPDADALQKMVIVSIENDYLVCNTYDYPSDVTGSVAINVAKPELLRHGTEYYTGNSVTSFTTTNAQQADVVAGGESETWVVNLKYAVGDKITAYAPIGGTGVSVGGESLAWEDKNTGGRKWGVQE